jgi:hypothetical protein
MHDSLQQGSRASHLILLPISRVFVSVSTLEAHRRRQLSHAREICETLRLAFFSPGEADDAARLLVSGVDEDMTI